jgi:hypothetical protein
MEHFDIEICCRECTVHLRKFISFYLVDEENNIYVDGEPKAYYKSIAK